MLKQIWNNTFASVCRIAFYSSDGIKSSVSATGFKVDGFIVTDENVYNQTDFDYVVFRFVKPNGYETELEIKMKSDKFVNRFLPIVHKENEGFALIDISGTKIEKLPSIHIASNPSVPVGSTVAILGFNNGQDNLSIRTGILSSYSYNSNLNKECFQFSASINQGNAGGPLVCVETEEVIGIIGHRLIALSKEYDHFKRIIDDNLRLLDGAQGQTTIGEVDPVQVLIASQNQLRQLGKEIYKRSHSSYGYATNIENLLKYLS